jgi:hypothetical protein
MRVPSLQEALDDVPAGGALTATLGDQPLDELLFTLHTGRFTGALRVGRPADRVYLREGAVVGLVPPPKQDVEGLAATLVQLKLLSRETLAAVWEDCAPEDGVALVRALLDAALLSPDAVTRATEEHARRRLFALYDRPPETEVELRSGLESLAHFNPVYLDVRPAIAFGMVVRADADRKAALAERVRGRRVGLLAPYDERRNSYGLPPPVLLALRDLAKGVRMQADGALPGLSPAETAGVLLLFERMSLLTVS